MTGPPAKREIERYSHAGVVRRLKLAKIIEIWLEACGNDPEHQQSNLTQQNPNLSIQKIPRREEKGSLLLQ
jgi:hypothetical protein